METVITPAKSEQSNGFPAENKKHQTMKALVYVGPEKIQRKNCCILGKIKDWN